MNIRKLKNACDNCDYKGDNLAILSIANEIIILCADCLEELKDLNNLLIASLITEK